MGFLLSQEGVGAYDLEELGRQERTGNVYGPSHVSFSPLLRMTQTELPDPHSLSERPHLPFPFGGSEYSMELETRLWIPNAWVQRLTISLPWSPWDDAWQQWPLLT